MAKLGRHFDRRVGESDGLADRRIFKIIASTSLSRGGCWGLGCSFGRNPSLSLRLATGWAGTILGQCWWDWGGIV
jgi:hypothetical protein